MTNEAFACAEAYLQRFFMRQLFQVLNEMWIELMLTLSLSKESAEAWAQKLAVWSEKLPTHPFSSAEEAAHNQWDHPELKKLLSGAQLEATTWKEDPAVTQARMEYLNKKGRVEESVRLAQLLGPDDRNRMVEDLLLMGKVDEAVEEGLKGRPTVEQAYSLARRVRESHPLGAYRLAKAALQLAARQPVMHYTAMVGGPTARNLALWLINHAHECDRYLRQNDRSLPATADPAAAAPVVDLDPTTVGPVVVPSLYDLCANVVGEAYSEMEPQEQADLIEDLPITMQSYASTVSIPPAVTHVF